MLAAAEPPAWADADSYCRFTAAAASSENSLLYSPSLFATFGVVDVSDVSTTGIPRTATRVTAGLNYSGQRVAMGWLGQRRAAADCALYRASSQLRALLFYGEEELERDALQARDAVLQERLPRAAAILAEEARAAEIGRSTIEALTAVQLRVDALTTLAGKTREQIGALASLAPHRTVAELLAARQQAAVESELLEEKGRRLRAFDVLLRAGLDREVGAPSRSPLFGLVTLSFNPGFFFQGPRESEARTAYAEWVPREAGGISARSEQLLSRLRATLAGERQRLSAVKIFLADLRQRMGLLGSIPGDKVARFRDSLWLEESQLEAERAYLAAHIASLRGALGEGQQ